MKQKDRRMCFSAIVQFRNYFLNSPEYRKLKKNSWATNPELVGGLASTIGLTIFAAIIIISDIFGYDTIFTLPIGFTLSKLYITINLMLILIVAIFGDTNLFSRNDLADYERLGKEIDRLIYDIVTRRRDVSTNAYYFSMEELDNDIKSIASVLNGMARNFRSIFSMDYQFGEFAESMREFELPAHTDIKQIRKFIKTFDSFELPNFDDIYEFVKTVIFYDIYCIDGVEFCTINSEQETILKDYAYSIKNSAWARERLEEFCAKELVNLEDDHSDYPIIMATCLYEASGFNEKRIEKLCKKIRKRNAKKTKQGNENKVDWI